MSEEIRLTGKQKAFADYYIQCKNAYRAAKLAGYKGTYATLGQVGQENLKKPVIREYINQAFRDREVTTEDVIDKLRDYHQGDMDDFLDDNGNVDLDKARGLGKTHLIKEYTVKHGPLSKTTGQPLWFEKKVKLYDSQSATETMARILQLDKRQIELSGEVGVKKEYVDYKESIGDSPDSKE